MIFGTFKKLVVGSIVKGKFTGENRQVVAEHQPVLVIREASFDEWAAEVIATGGLIDERIRRRTAGAYYYEVATD